ncbi:ABC transporter substrate-binding protein [Mesorhizobium sp.]|uniref:ABC transporter substrate-binding protein n=1 Tax=Mesorhizobium sp. TaxID=1871066 RepID=UPI0025CD3FDF|nr:ABC transporter substrate-binding protein [Mesorhizobium sp.]
MSIKTQGRYAGILLVTVSAMLAASASGHASDNDALTIGIDHFPTNLDPGQNAWRQQQAILHLAAGTLTNQESDGKQVTMGLAASVEPADKRFLVKLKPGLKFSDGSALTATDVVASFKYYMNDKTNGYGYTFAPIEKVIATDDLTVTFELKQPYPSLPFILALPSSAIIPSEFVDAKDPKDIYSGDHPLPTAGPFQVQSFGQDEITLQRNPYYAGAQPSTKTIIFKKITDPAARLAQLQGGEIDWADNISPKLLPQLAAPVEARSAMAINGLDFLSLNNRNNSLLSDVRIRKAIAAAINRKQLNAIAYAGRSQPALSLWASASRYNKPFLSPDPDVTRAKELLAGTKCENGCGLKLITNSASEGASDTAIVVQQNLKAIGIEVEMVKADGATINDWLTQANFDIWAGASFDVAEFPDGYLAWTIGQPSEAQFSGYKSPEMTRLMQRVNFATGSERDAAVADLNALFEKDLPIVPTTNYVVVSASRVPSEVFNIAPTMYFDVH